MDTVENFRIKCLTDDDFYQISRMLNCELAVLKAGWQVETSGRGSFFAPGMPAILFERHIFWNQLKKRDLNPVDYVKGNEAIFYPKWTEQYYKDDIREYDRSEQARKINKEAAEASTSWGMFQIMDFNYVVCGEASVESFVQSMCESEYKQLLLFANFIKSNLPMLRALQSKDWATFANCYNGSAYVQNRYDVKLEAAYLKFRV